MAHYRDFITTDDHSYNVFCALRYCMENGDNSLIFEKGRYDFYGEMASQTFISVSNHGINNLEKIVFMIKNMKNFTVDGGGSEFVFHGAIMPFALIGSENICLKNFSIDYENAMTLVGETVFAEGDCVKVRIDEDLKWYTSGKKLYSVDCCGNAAPYLYMHIKGPYRRMNYSHEARDIFSKDISFDTENGLLCVNNTGIEIPVGECVMFTPAARMAADILIDGGNDTRIENVTLYRSYGMGLIAQKTKNVSVKSMTVCAKRGRHLSLAADCTHFVNCRGRIEVCDSVFENQFDDALNIHGIFNKITAKGDDFILVKYMHSDTKGIDIYENGGHFQALDNETLIPYSRYTVKKLEKINIEYTKIYTEERTDKINIGDLTEDITYKTELLFKNNIVRNNRGRGMLIASKGETIICENKFSGPGAAVLFESDGKRWYESGGTEEVVICENTFDGCLFGSADNWGDAVIDVKPRERFDGENYYHKYIEVSKNHFIGGEKTLFSADNVENVVFKQNMIENQIGKTVEFKNCKKIICDSK